MNDTAIRSFIGIFPPDEIIKKILRIQSELQSFGRSIKWERPEKFHCTVEFLGAKPRAWLDQLNSALCATQNLGRCKMMVSQCGVFPSANSPKAVWVGSDESGNNDIINFAMRIKEITQTLGHRPENKPFFPHITLGRVKGKMSPALIQSIETVTFQPVEFSCTEIRLIKSELSSSGSTYTTLYTIPF